MTMSQTGACDVAREDLLAPLPFTRAESLAKIRAATDAQIISDDYAQILIELVDVVSAFEPKA